MRWNLKPDPKDGEYQVFKVFALLPEKVGSTMVWLENYYVVQKYTAWKYVVAPNGESGRWGTVNRLTKTEAAKMDAVGEVRIANNILTQKDKK